jgi:hypothetical protein
MLAIFLAGASWININSLLNVAVQMSVPRWVLGRMIALFMTFIFGGMAIGSWVWGGVAEAFSVQLAFLIAALALMIGLFWGYVFPIESSLDADLSPLNHFVEPQVRLQLSQRRGPLMIMVEYDIRQENVEKFLGVMATWRRIRIRDGARRWSLMRDVEFPNRWIETYHVASWTEYVRHVERRTLADEAVIRAINSLHHGDSPSRVSRMVEQQAGTRNDDASLVVIRPTEL